MLTRTLLATRSSCPLSPRAAMSSSSSTTPVRATRSSRSSAAATVKDEPATSTSPLSAGRVKRRASSPAASTPKKARSTPTTKPAAAAASPTPPSSADRKPPTPTKKPAAYLTTPYPDYARPTPDECERVTTLLAGLHGMPQRPGRVEKLPEGEPPRVGEACGAVPSVLDALIRTVLSQNTSNANSTRAYASLLATFGPSRANPRAVSLPAVFRAEIPQVQDAIRCGGLANVKGKVLAGVLRTVYERNVGVAAAATATKTEQGADRKVEGKETDVKPTPLVKSESASPTGATPAAPVLSADVKPLKRSSSPDLAPLVAVADSATDLDDAALERLLSLDYVHAMDDEAAMRELESFPGVGPKTASCVLLFCLARDSFAVDTHVFRLSKALGWVPAKATRETTYAHLDVRIPSALKYPLHVLLIAHGKACARCAANGRATKPELGPCPLVGLRKSGSAAAGVKTEDEGEEEDEEGGAADVGGQAMPEDVKRVLEADVAQAAAAAAS